MSGARPAVLGILLVTLAMGCRGVRVEPPLRPKSGAAALAEGRQTYRRACASCHGVDGHGDGPVAPTLLEPPPDLTRLAARHGGAFPRDLVSEIVTGARRVPAHGTRAMPVWSLRFEPRTGATAAAALYVRQRLDRLLDYLESIQVRG
ncbi:MAG TPA: cytochrome c [Candidatus Binatia bacterium]|nr:cytochrome c [Candidatus Binatia bacterium]